MLIAQLPVAGEDDDRLHSTVSADVGRANSSQLGSSNPAFSQDHAALEEYACDRSNLPWVIFRAAHRANHVAALPARSRALLAALARTVDASRPFAAIFARRELLTGRALQSMRTFYRSLSDLETEGFISRPPQKRHGDAGLFGRAYLHLTEKAASLLGLVESGHADIETTRPIRPLQTSSPTVSSFDHPSVTVADGAIYKDLYPDTQKRQPASLPDDLHRLLSLGFHRFMIFKLMREARQQSKRLSDVVEITWDHLKRANHPINYLRALLRSPVDFSHQLRALQSARLEAERRDAQSRLTQETAEQHAGQAFFDESSQNRFVLSMDAREISVHHHRESKPRIRTANWQDEFVAALAAGILQPATSTLEARFASKRDASTPPVLDPRNRIEIEPSRSARSETIVQSLNEMKRLLREACAGHQIPAYPR